MRLPERLISPRPLRLAVERALGDPLVAARARALAAWAAGHDGALAAAVEVERLAGL